MCPLKIAPSGSLFNPHFNRGELGIIRPVRNDELAPQWLLQRFVAPDRTSALSCFTAIYAVITSHSITKSTAFPLIESSSVAA